MLKYSDQGPSLWLDHAYQDGAGSASVEGLLASGTIQGMTSSTGLQLSADLHWLFNNPDLRLFAYANQDGEAVLTELVTEKIRRLADTFLPLFERTNGEHGLVCIDVDPRTYRDAQELEALTLRMWNLINRPNLMVSIPAIEAGIPVIRHALERGVNVNVILLHSLDRYLQVVDAYISALEARLEQGAAIEHILSVASFELSIIDRQIDRRLSGYRGSGAEARRAEALCGHIGLATAKLAYAQFKASFSDERFARLSEHGARTQRLLWSAFDGQSDGDQKAHYLRQLVGHQTIVALPSADLQPSYKQEAVEATLDEGLSEARGQLQALESIGLSMYAASVDIEEELIEARESGYEELLRAVSESLDHYRIELEPICDPYCTIIKNIDTQSIIRRIWQSDGSVWSMDRRAADRISGQMGWLDLPAHSKALIEPCAQYIKSLRGEGVSTIVFFSTGSVAAYLELVKAQPGDSPGNLLVLDPADDEELRQVVENNPVQRTVFVFTAGNRGLKVDEASLEPAWNVLRDQYGFDPGDRVTLIAHPSAAEKLTQAGYHCRRAFFIPPDLPVHFSSLSYTGLLAAHWMGIDLDDLVAGLGDIFIRCRPDREGYRNPAISLAAAIAAGFQNGFSPIVLSSPPGLVSMLEWAQALLNDAGLIGPGLLDVAITNPTDMSTAADAKPNVIQLQDELAVGTEIKALINAGLPVKILTRFGEGNCIGGWTGMWLFATAALGHLLGVNPFDPA